MFLYNINIWKHNYLCYMLPIKFIIFLLHVNKWSNMGFLYLMSDLSLQPTFLYLIAIHFCTYWKSKFKCNSPFTTKLNYLARDIFLDVCKFSHLHLIIHPPLVVLRYRKFITHTIHLEYWFHCKSLIWDIRISKEWKLRVEVLVRPTMNWGTYTSLT